MLSLLCLSESAAHALKITGFYLLLALGSYLLGNISNAKILARTQKDDITKHDSGNPGTINMLRTHGVSMGFFTLILDMLKGAIPCIIGFFAFGGFNNFMEAKIAIYVAGTAAVIGHCYPVFYKFKGGKGVATAAGMACVAHPWIALILFGVYVALLIITKIGSLSSLIIAFAYIIYDSVTLIIDKNYVALGLLIFVLLLIVWRHKANIKRLIEKRENVIDLQEAVNKDVQRINKHRQKKQQKNAEVAAQTENVADNNSQSDVVNSQTETIKSEEVGAQEPVKSEETNVTKPQQSEKKG